MRYPRFVLDVAAPQNRHKLWWGIWSGYGVAACFAVLIAAGVLSGVIPFRWAFVALVAIKLSTNTIAALALRADRAVLEASGLNLAGDVVAMTGAIYLTGGPTSPLVPVYAIEITVIALLTNLGVTVQAATLLFAAYSAMTLALVRGWVPLYVSPVATAAWTPAAIATDIAFVAFILGVPTFFAGKILAELRDKQRSLERTNEALIEAGRQKSQFMANVTHELRTPIHGIVGLADLVATGVYGETTAEQRSAMSDVRTSALSLLHLIDDLLELTRADAGRTEIRSTDTDLQELLPATMAAVRWMKGNKDVELSLESDALPRVRTDPRRLKQILINLLANAVKFTPEGGHVRLRAHAGPAEIVLEVHDDGPGIANEDLERVFEPFRQLDGSVEREHGGVGLGLAVVRELASALWAVVEVESVVGEGSVFRVRLPLAPPDRHDPQHEREQPEREQREPPHE